MRTMTGVLAGFVAALAAGSAQAQPASEPASPPIEAPAAAPAVEQVDPSDAVPLVAPAPPLAGAAYDSRIRASLISSQAFQGPLDGAWRLAGSSGALYDFQLVDRSNGVVEGAWRDVRRPGALTSSGFVDAIERHGGAVRLRFGGDKVAMLTAGADGRWTGELMEPEGRKPVTFSRGSP
jgi:hypothetical protein